MQLKTFLQLKMLAVQLIAELGKAELKSLSTLMSDQRLISAAYSQRNWSPVHRDRPATTSILEASRTPVEPLMTVTSNQAHA